MDNEITTRVAVWLLDPKHTKTKLAALLGVTSPTLDKRLRGISQWTFDDARKIAELTGCTLNDLAGI